MPQDQNGFNPSELKRITIFVGAYGSGKSEVSVNFAFWLAKKDKPVILCDLDIINPFYRPADARRAIEDAGIRLVAPLYAGSNVEAPAVPADVFSVFDESGCRAVLDIGGEDLGARVIASLKNRFWNCLAEVSLYMVINPCRPFTDSHEAIEKMARELEHSAGMSITGLVHNANLLEHGDSELLIESWPVIREASEKLGVPVVFAAAMKPAAELAPKLVLPGDLPVLWLSRSILYPTD